jgi:putative spermidine/putrescine transport system substrate-binding protein
MGEAKRKVLYEPFTKETGIPIVEVAGPELAKIKVQVRSKDVEWDMVDVLGSWLPICEKSDFLEPIDESIVNRKGIIKQAHREHALGATIYAGGIAYPSDRMGAQGKHPTSWPEFWDVKNIPGRRGLRTRISDTMEIALMGDGVPASEVYPCDVERAFKALDRIKPHVSHWIPQTSQTISLIQANECDFTFTYTTRVMNAQKADLPIDFIFNQNLMGIGWTAILKGTRRRDAAMRLASFIMDPDRQVELCNLTADAPVFPDAHDKIDKNVRKWIPDPTDPNNLFVNHDWWDGKLEKLTERFKEWTLT